jgi:hypothetical protein
MGDGVEAFTGTSHHNTDNATGMGLSTSLPYLAYLTGHFAFNRTQNRILPFSIDSVTWKKDIYNVMISVIQDVPHDMTGKVETTRSQSPFRQAPETGSWFHSELDALTFCASSDVSS